MRCPLTVTLHKQLVIISVKRRGNIYLLLTLSNKSRSNSPVAAQIDANICFTKTLCSMQTALSVAVICHLLKEWNLNLAQTKVDRMPSVKQRCMKVSMFSQTISQWVHETSIVIAIMFKACPIRYPVQMVKATRSLHMDAHQMTCVVWALSKIIWLPRVCPKFFQPRISRNAAWLDAVLTPFCMRKSIAK